MEEQGAPKVEAAQYVIPFVADMSDVDAALDRIESRAEDIAKKLGNPLGADTDGGPSQPQSPEGRPTSPSPPRGDDRDGMEVLRREVSAAALAVRDAASDVRDLTSAVGELAGVVAASFQNRGM